MDREPVVCHPDLEERLQAWPAELPDDFFELTVDDVRRRLAQLKSERWVLPQCLPASSSQGLPHRVPVLPAVPRCQHWLVAQVPDRLPLRAPQRVGA